METESVHVIGSGRVGSAVSARLTERGFAVGVDDPELVLICVPDGAIAEVAASVKLGPWVAHVSGATPLAAASLRTGSLLDGASSRHEPALHR